MKMHTIYKLFAELQQRGICTEGCYAANPLPFNRRYKIGISENGCPMFFVPSTSTSFSVDINMEMITVLFGRVCKIHDTCYSEGIYTIITLKTGDIDIQKYFIDIVGILLEQLPDSYSDAILIQEIQKLVNLFSELSQPPRKTIQGLWAELLIIEQSSNPEYLIKSWHVDTNDKYDFNDGQDKLEVKSSVRPERIHHFSIDQLHSNSSSNLLIASVNTTFVGQGVGILELRDRICSKIRDSQIQFRLNEVILKTIGDNMSIVTDVFFDYALAVDSLAFFKAKDIPCIPLESIPLGVTNVHFDSDLTGVSPVNHSKMIDYKGLLFNYISL